MSDVSSTKKAPSAVLQQPAAQPAKKKFFASKQEKISSLLFLGVSIAYVKFVLFGLSYPFAEWSMVLFLFVFFAVVEISARLCKVAFSKESAFWAVAMLAIAVGTTMQNNEWVLGAYGWILLHLTAAQFALTRLGGAAESKAGSLIPFDFVRAWFILPFSNFLRNIQVLCYGIKLPRKFSRSKEWLWVAMGLLLALPLLLWSFSTLVQADKIFEHTMGRWGYWLSQWSPLEMLSQWFDFYSLVLYGFFWCWFYGLFYGAFHSKENTNRLKTQEIYSFLEKIRQFPGKVFAIPVALLAALYLLFFVSQLQYFTGGFLGVLPQKYTVAEYARQGFFELLRIASVNLGVLVVCQKLARNGMENSRVLRWFAMVLMACNLLFVAIASSKLGLYISCFGLTPKRVLAAYAIVVVALWSVLAMVRLLRPFRVAEVAIHLAALLFCLLCWLPWNQWIQENPRHSTVESTEIYYGQIDPNF